MVLMKDIIKQEALIDDLFKPYESTIGKDFNTYRNHVYRLFNLILKMKGNTAEADRQKIAIAAVFHDIGIWTDQTFDYIQPSVELAKEYLNKVGKSDWIEEVSLLISEHHKISKYKGQYSSNVVPFIKADLVEVSNGFFLFNIEKDYYQALQKMFPTLGFHRLLLKLGLKNWSKNFFKPLPMMKW